jgi:hypothetical protein
MSLLRGDPVRHTQQIARRYLDAWTAGDIRIDERDASLDAAAHQDDVVFRDGMITRSPFVTDMAAFTAFVGA